MFDDADFGGARFSIAEFNLKGLVGGVIGFIEFEVEALAFADEVEALSDMETDEFVFGSMIEEIFADEFELAVVVLGVKADAAFGERNAETIGLGVFKLAINGNFFAAGGAVFGIFADIDSELPGVVLGDGIVNEEAGGFDGGGAEKLDLFGFFVAEGGGAGESIKVKFVEGFFGDSECRRLNRFSSIAFDHCRLWT